MYFVVGFKPVTSVSAKQDLGCGRIWEIYFFPKLKLRILSKTCLIQPSTTLTKAKCDISLDIHEKLTNFQLVETLQKRTLSIEHGYEWLKDDSIFTFQSIEGRLVVHDINIFLLVFFKQLFWTIQLGRGTKCLINESCLRSIIIFHYYSA